jgi:hypothetical protein
MYAGADFVLTRSTPGNIETVLLHELGHVFHMDDLQKSRKFFGKPINEFLLPYAQALIPHQLPRRYVFEEWSNYSTTSNENFLTEFYAEAFSSFYASPTSHKEFKDPRSVYGEKTSMNDPFVAAYRAVATVFGDRPVWYGKNIKDATISWSLDEDFPLALHEMEPAFYKKDESCHLHVSYECPTNAFQLVRSVFVKSATPETCAFNKTYACNGQNDYFCREVVAAVDGTPTWGQSFIYLDVGNHVRLYEPLGEGKGLGDQLLAPGPAPVKDQPTQGDQAK